MRIRDILQLRRAGPGRAFSALLNGLLPPKVKMRAAVLGALSGGRGLEIGGPSRVFARSKILPVYEVAQRIDNVNYAGETAWEKGLRDGGSFSYGQGRQLGVQWIREAHALTGIADETYDFVISSHCLEHVANPLLALREWQRVVKPGGYLLVIVPSRAGTFDHRRAVTQLEHLLDDAKRSTPENDLTHLDEILSLHDLRRDPHAGNAEKFRERSLRNGENRCLHHHVFDLALLTSSLVETGWKILAGEQVRPIHLIAFGRNSDSPLKHAQ